MSAASGLGLFIRCIIGVPPPIASDISNNHKISDTNPHHLHRCHVYSRLTLQGLQHLDCPVLSPLFLFGTRRTLLGSTRNDPLGPPKPHGGHLFLLVPTNTLLFFCSLGIGNKPWLQARSILLFAELHALSVCC